MPRSGRHAAARREVPLAQPGSRAGKPQQRAGELPRDEGEQHRAGGDGGDGDGGQCERQGTPAGGGPGEEAVRDAGPGRHGLVAHARRLVTRGRVAGHGAGPRRARSRRPRARAGRRRAATAASSRGPTATTRATSRPDESVTATDSTCAGDPLGGATPREQEARRRADGSAPSGRAPAPASSPSVPAALLASTRPAVTTRTAAGASIWRPRTAAAAASRARDASSGCPVARLAERSRAAARARSPSPAQRCSRYADTEATSRRNAAASAEARARGTTTATTRPAATSGPASTPANTSANRARRDTRPPGRRSDRDTGRSRAPSHASDVAPCRSTPSTVRPTAGRVRIFLFFTSLASDKRSTHCRPPMTLRQGVSCRTAPASWRAFRRSCLRRRRSRPPCGVGSAPSGPAARPPNGPRRPARS